MIVARQTETTPIPVQLDPELRKQVEWFLQRMMQSFTRKAGETVSLICGHTLTVAVLDSLSDARLCWFLNDNPLIMDASRILYNKGNLDVTDLTPGDTGVYVCVAQWGPEKARDNVTVGVYSLVVTADNPTRYVFESDGMLLVSNSQPLGRLFPTAVRQWFYNSTNSSTLTSTLAKNNTAELVPRVSKSMAGVWECRVHHQETQRVWSTAWYQIGVQNAPSLVARIYRVLVDHLYVTIVVASIILLLIIAVFIYAVRLMKQKEDETDEEFIKTRNGWEKTLSQFGTGGKVKVKDSDLPPKREDQSGAMEGKTEEEEGKEGGTASNLVGAKEGEEVKANEVNLLDESGERDDNREMSDAMMLDESGEIDESQEKDVVEEVDDGVDDINKIDGRGDEVDAGDESDTNKSAVLSLKARRRRRRRGQQIEAHTRAPGGNTASLGNDENISNMARCTAGRDSSASRFRNADKKTQSRHAWSNRRRREKRMWLIYPEVSKESAFKWLFKYSPSLRKLGSVLWEGETSHTVPEGYDRDVVPLRSMQTGPETHQEDASSFPASCSSSARAHSWRMPELRAPDMRAWIERGRQTVSGWTNQPSSWGHGGVRYTVLPQAEDTEFMDV